LRCTELKLDGGEHVSFALVQRATDAHLLALFSNLAGLHRGRLLLLQAPHRRRQQRLVQWRKESTHSTAGTQRALWNTDQGGRQMKCPPVTCTLAWSGNRTENQDGRLMKAQERVCTPACTLGGHLKSGFSLENAGIGASDFMF
jgi:hypothetical protein